MFATRRSQLIFLALNGLGIATFLYLGSRLWVDRRVADVPGGQLGKYLGWEIFSGFLSLAVVLAGLTVFVVALRKPHWPMRAKVALLAIVVMGGWLAAIWFDAAHRVID